MFCFDVELHPFGMRKKYIVRRIDVDVDFENIIFHIYTGGMYCVQSYQYS